MMAITLALAVFQTGYLPSTKADFDAEVQFLMDWKGDFDPGWVEGLRQKHQIELIKAAGFLPLSFPSIVWSRPREAVWEPVWISLEQKLFKSVPRLGGYQSRETNLDNWDQYENERIRQNVLSTTLLQFYLDPNMEAKAFESKSWIEKMPYQSHDESKHEYQDIRRPRRTSGLPTEGEKAPEIFAPGYFDLIFPYGIHDYGH